MLLLSTIVLCSLLTNVSAQNQVTQIEEAFLNNVECVSVDSVPLVFARIMVMFKVNESQYDELNKKYYDSLKSVLVERRFEEEITKYCANNTFDDIYRKKFLEIAPTIKTNVERQIERLCPNGIEIFNVWLKKPHFSKRDINNRYTYQQGGSRHVLNSKYEEMELQWINQLITEEEIKSEKLAKEKERVIAVADAVREKEVRLIQLELQRQELEIRKNITDVQNEILKMSERNLANIAKYKAEKESESNKLLLTDQYLKLKTAHALANNTKIFFSGDDSPLAAIINQIFNNNSEKKKYD